MYELIAGIDRLHTTPMGEERVKRNLNLDTDDPVGWCAERISSPDAKIERRGKNWYITIDGCIITVNAHSFTIITAHKAD